jgi:hypothetical protein
MYMYQLCFSNIRLIVHWFATPYNRDGKSMAREKFYYYILYNIIGPII